MSEPNQDNGASPAAPPPAAAPPPPAAAGWGPGYGQAPGYGQGVPGPGQHGTPPVGTPPVGTPPVGTPQYGTPQYGAPQYGAPQYGQPQYGQPQYGQPQYGAPGTFRPAPVQRGIVPLRPLSLGEIFDGGFRSIRANPRVMFGVSAVVVTISVLIQSIAQWYSLGFLGDMMSAPIDEQSDMLLGDVAGIWSGQAFSGLLTLIVTTMLTGLLIISVSRSVIGQKISLADAWARARPQLWRLLRLTLLVIIVMMSVPLLWVGALVGVLALEQYGLAAVVGLLGGAGMLVWLAWISVRTLLATPALMLEDQRVLAGFKRGWALSRGSFWRLLGIYLLTNVMVATVAYLIIGPVTIGAMLVTSDGMNDLTYITDPLYLAVTAVGTVIATVLTTPFTAAVVALLYIDTRMRREGLDVELARAAEAAAHEAAGRAKG